MRAEAMERLIPESKAVFFPRHVASPHRGRLAPGGHVGANASRCEDAMARQRCETCRFFQAAGLAGSGWCHHPQRKTTSDLLIMVRKNELACRDSWSHSLWEAGSYEDDHPGEGAE